VGQGCRADLEHCENAGRIYRPIGVYAGLSYELADLRICVRTSGAIGLKQIYLADFTDLWSYQSINQSFIICTEPQKTCGSIPVYGFAGLYVRSFWAEIQVNNTHELMK